MWGIIIMVIIMSLMLRTIQKEKKRIDFMLAAYLKQLETLPKGSVVAKTAGRNCYYYLKYRSGKKVMTDYLGKDGEKVEDVRAKVEKRRHIETMIAQLQSEQAIAIKVLEEKG
jgi:porphobilinogen deaminase